MEAMIQAENRWRNNTYLKSGGFKAGLWKIVTWPFSQFKEPTAEPTFGERSAAKFALLF